MGLSLGQWGDRLVGVGRGSTRGFGWVCAMGGVLKGDSAGVWGVCGVSDWRGGIGVEHGGCGGVWYGGVSGGLWNRGESVGWGNWVVL